MITLVFATNNKHKVEEIRNVVGNSFTVITLSEAGIDIDIPEPHDRLEENASEKSKTIHRMTGLSCFGEDTGLEVTALNGAPGVKSARYAGDARDFESNIVKLLTNLAGEENRTARFRTVISLIFDNNEYLFEGICTGKIIDKQKGHNGFGYDAVFVPDGSERTFAEMDLKEKNIFSHRKKAVEQLLVFLKKQGDM